MEEKEHLEIAGMDWKRLEENLRTTERGKRGETSSEAALREYFGNEEYEYLQKLAAHAHTVRSRTPVLETVVFLPGIMGSNLITIDKDGDKDLVWINLFRLAVGQIERLRLSPDGSRDYDPQSTVQPSGMDKRTYARAILWLRASWNVEPFCFDWRKDIDDAADALAAFIRKLGDQPINLVAHSMGGLVCRNFIRRHRKQWEAMRKGDGGRGGYLVMLGTPNYGSFAIPQVMTGEETMVKLLAAADLTNNLSEILAIINTFVGSYQMLPSPTKLPTSMNVLYRRESWGGYPVSERHLARGLQFHQDMEREDTIDLERMFYIAGCNRQTLSGLKFIAPGEFDYTITHDGDGRVPHALGLLKGVPTYYVDESHGDLPKSEKVLITVDELLKQGCTSVLSDQPIVSRAVMPEGAHWRRPVDEQRHGNVLRAISEQAKKGQASPEEVRFAEETIMRAIIGQVRPKGQPAPQEKKASGLQMRTIPLHVEVVRGDVAEIESPVIVIGHYKGVAPVSAEGEIDKALDYWITRAGQQGIIGADLGELFFIPVTRKQIAAKFVLLAGMGEEGRFTKDDLRYLMTNCTSAVSALQLDTFATVLIGSGTGNLSKKRALRGMIEGISDALRRLPQENRVKKIIVVECSSRAYGDIAKSLKVLKDEGMFPDLELEDTRKKLPLTKRSRKEERPFDIPSESLPGTRITVERDKDIFRFSALSKDAVIPVRETEVQSLFTVGISQRLMSSSTPAEQMEYGQLLATYLIPQDFRRLIEDAESLTLILDRSTASFPWEMACLKSTRGRGTTFFGPDLKLTRQFRTILSSPGVVPRLNEALKVLVIADPARELELQLSGARREGCEVVSVLNHFKKDKGLDITVVERIGAAECDPVEILALLLNEEFDIVHFAGHGVFDEKDPSHSGWVFGRDCILSAREIFSTRRVPRLVFSNACFSAVIKERKAMTADEPNRRLAGLAEAFFERSITNYIGAGWPVNDDPAVEFASVFYQKALAGEPLGDALAAARNKIMGQGSTWGAYQHYGQVNGTLITKTRGRKG